MFPCGLRTVFLSPVRVKEVRLPASRRTVSKEAKVALSTLVLSKDVVRCSSMRAMSSRRSLPPYREGGRVRCRSGCVHVCATWRLPGADLPHRVVVRHSRGPPRANRQDNSCHHQQKLHTTPAQPRTSDPPRLLCVWSIPQSRILCASPHNPLP